MQISSHVTTHLYQAVVSILSATAQMHGATPEQVDPQQPITDDEVLTQDLMGYLSTSELGELAGLHECRNAIMTAWRSIEACRARLLWRAIKRSKRE